MIQCFLIILDANTRYGPLHLFQSPVFCLCLMCKVVSFVWVLCKVFPLVSAVDSQNLAPVILTHKAEVTFFTFITKNMVSLGKDRSCLVKLTHKNYL